MGIFGGTGDVYEVSGPDIKSINSFEETNVGVAQKTVAAGGKDFLYSYAPHSFTMIKIKLQ